MFVVSSQKWLSRILGTSIFIGAAVLSIATQPPPCESDEDCDDGEICRGLTDQGETYAYCGIPFCDDDSDCEDGEVCDPDYDEFGSGCASPELDAGSPEVDAGSPATDAGS